MKLYKVTEIAEVIRRRYITWVPEEVNNYYDVKGSVSVRKTCSGKISTRVL